MTTPTLSAPTFMFAPSKTWFMPVTYSNPAAADGTPGAPIDLTGSTVTGILFVRGQLVGIPLNAANDGVTVDAPNGVMNFLVTEQQTAAFVADPPTPLGMSVSYPTRLEVDIRDSLGRLSVAAIFPISVFDPRFVDPGMFAQEQAGSIVAAAEQGPPGPAISVNGHTGLVQNLSASDVGAYTQAQADAGALVSSLIFG